MAVLNMNLIRALVSQLRETQALACGGGCGGVQTKTIISPEILNFGDIIINGQNCAVYFGDDEADSMWMWLTECHN